tara:strand:- start:1874 stop:2524 length:651 start_codon:yes stop_codon:yes gene_type:complete
MGNRRIGRKRLYALNKAGEKLTSTAGPALEGNIGAQTRLRESELIVTDITIDLGSSAAAAHCFPMKAVVDGEGVGVDMVIGVSSSASNSGSLGAWTGNGNAQIMLINGTASAADSVGIITSGELMCVEHPVGGAKTIGLSFSSTATGSGSPLDSGATDLVDSSTSQALGTYTSFDVSDADLDNKFLYLVSSGSTDGAYTAGKFILRLYGYNVFSDV